jgi:hypothetical protein
MSKPSSILLACVLASACSPSSSSPLTAAPDPSPPSSGATADSASPGAPASGSCTAARVEAPVTKTFSGKFPGFATWLSDSGRLAVLYQFKTDDDHDGKIEPAFGHHGEPGGDLPTISVFDLVAGTETPVDAVVASDVGARYLVVRDKQHLYLLDGATGGREDLAQKGADLTQDRNCTFGAREAGLDNTGDRLFYLRTKPARVVVRDIATGAEIELAPKKGGIWRASAEALPGWASFAEIEDTNHNGKIDLPVQQTTCPCPPWGRFAMSCSTGGLTGDDDFTWWLVSSGGARIAMPDGALVPVGDRTAMDPKAQKIVDATGKPIALPAKCSGAAPLVGAPGVLLTCEEGSRLFFPDNGKEVRYAGVKVRPATRAVRAADTRLWVGVQVEDAGGTSLFSRLRDDGRLEKGIALGALSRHVLPSGWVQGALPRGSIVENVATGKQVQVDVPQKVDPLSAVVGRLEDGSFIAVAPERCVYAASKESPQLATSKGCFLVPAKAGGDLEEGPWTLRCAR